MFTTILLKLICTISLLVISVTMLARANDLRLRPGWHWNVRLLGFVLSGASPFGIIGYGWADSYSMAFLYLTVFLFGQACVFVTTPYLPPWWRWISKDGNDQVVHSDDRRAPQ